MLFCSICSANASSIKVPLGILKDPSFEDNGSAKTLPKISGKYFSEKIITDSYKKTYDENDQKKLYEISKNLIMKFSK